MSGPIFVLDARGTPLMPMAAAYARKLLRSGKAHRVPHHAFTVLQLTQHREQPLLRAIGVGITIHLHTAELLLIADGDPAPFPLVRIHVDLRTDLLARMRRRAAHRRRRRSRGRYRAMRRHGVPFKLRRPHLRRSTWGSALRQRQRQHQRSGPPHLAATIRWRAQAIERVIRTLSRFVPISHAFISEPPWESNTALSGLTPAERRTTLVSSYGKAITPSRRIAMCSYCGTTTGSIEVEHLLPKSRGGTDAWANLVLACRACNQRKGQRTPAEAGMTLCVQPAPKLTFPNRTRPYIRWTARILREHLAAMGIALGQAHAQTTTGVQVSPALRAQLTTDITVPTMVARPIGRPPHQIYTARNYPLTTPPRVGLVRLGTKLKRRILVNRGLVVCSHDQRTSVQVIPADTLPPPDRMLITHGMLCMGQRGEKMVTGIVAAIHSVGRVTLLTNPTIGPNGVQWQRVVVSPRRRLRVLSTDKVIFFPLTEDRPDAPEKRR